MGKDCDVFEHLFAAVAEARSLHCANLQRAAQTVDNQCCQCLAVYVLCDDEQRTSALCHCLEHWEHIFQRADFLVVEQDVWVVHLTLHLLGVGHEVRRDITAVELHAFNNLHCSVGAFSLLDSDHALFLHLAHSVGDELADFSVVVG